MGVAHKEGGTGETGKYIYGKRGEYGLGGGVHTRKREVAAVGVVGGEGLYEGKVENGESRSRSSPSPSLFNT